MIITLTILVILALGVFLFMQTAVFGRNPSGKRLEKIEQSPHYKDGAFQNLNPTSVMVKDASMLKMIVDFFNKPKTTEPQYPLPSVQTNLVALNDDKPSIVWFGHSSYLIKSKGKNVLVDPVQWQCIPCFFICESF